MPLKTFADCAACPMLRFCSAHISNGEWKHDKGVDPCVVVDDDESWKDHYLEVIRESRKTKESFSDVFARINAKYAMGVTL